MIAALCLTLTGCGAQSPEEQILGEWRSADGEVSWIFYENGNMAGGSDDDREGGRWYIDERTLSIEAAYEAVVFQYEIDEDILRLYDAGEPEAEMYRYDGEMPAIRDSLEELREQLEDSDFFASALEQVRSDDAADEILYQFEVSQNNDIGVPEFEYTMTCTTQYEYAAENIVDRVVLGYSPLSEEFYLASDRTRGTYCSNWNVNGTWTGEFGEDYIEFSIDSVEFSSSPSDYEREYVVTYSYDYDDFKYRGRTVNYVGEGEAVLSENYLFIEDENTSLIFIFDPVNGISERSGEALVSPVGQLQRVI